MNSTSRSSLLSLIIVVGVVAFVLTAWEVIAVASPRMSFLLGRPSEIFVELWTMMCREQLYYHLPSQEAKLFVV